MFVPWYALIGIGIGAIWMVKHVEGEIEMLKIRVAELEELTEHLNPRLDS